MVTFTVNLSDTFWIANSSFLLPIQHHGQIISDTTVTSITGRAAMALAKCRLLRDRATHRKLRGILGG